MTHVMTFILKSGNPVQLHDEINAFLTKKPGIEVVNVTTSRHPYYEDAKPQEMTFVLLFYKE